MTREPRFRPTILHGQDYSDVFGFGVFDEISETLEISRIKSGQIKAAVIG
jgi:hypothetical protein